jgi:hypothetical protein
LFWDLFWELVVYTPCKYTCFCCRTVVHTPNKAVYTIRDPVLLSKIYSFSHFLVNRLNVSDFNWLLRTSKVSQEQRESDIFFFEKKDASSLWITKYERKDTRILQGALEPNSS